MKKVKLIIKALVFTCVTSKSFATDTLVVVFNSKSSNQYIQESVNKCYKNICIINKSYWAKFLLGESEKKINYQFEFSHLVVVDSLNLRATEEENLLLLRSILKKMYDSTSNKRSKQAKEIAQNLNTINQQIESGKVVLKKAKLSQSRYNFIYLDSIKTESQAKEFEEKIKQSKIFIYDQSLLPKKNKLILYRVSVLQLMPIKNKNLQF